MTENDKRIRKILIDGIKCADKEIRRCSGTSPEQHLPHIQEKLLPFYLATDLIDELQDSVQ